MPTAATKITPARLAERFGGTVDGDGWILGATVAGQNCSLWLTPDGKVCAQSDGGRYCDGQLSLYAAMDVGAPLPLVASKAARQYTAANDNSAISATRWALPDRQAIPPREWLYGRHLIRKFVSATIAPGGVGKTSLKIAEAVCLATGRDLLGEYVHDKAAVWLWNGEDPQEELDRRVAATCRHYGISNGDLGGRLYVDSGRRMPIITATADRNGTRIAVPIVDALIKEIEARGIDAMIVDPFVSSHGVPENDNGSIDAVVKQTWATIADRTGCAIDLVHHSKKLGGQEATAESARGGVAFIGAVRAAATLNAMTGDEANRAGVDNPTSYFRVTDAKANMAPRSDKSKWFQIVSHDLGNATQERPADHVGVVVPWQWPAALDGVTVRDLLSVQRILHAGAYKDSSQAANWAGHAVAEALELDLSDDKDKAKAKALLREWKKSGALKVEHKEDENRKKRPFVVVGEWATEPETDA